MSQSRSTAFQKYRKTASWGTNNDKKQNKKNTRYETIDARKQGTLTKEPSWNEQWKSTGGA